LKVICQSYQELFSGTDLWRHALDIAGGSK
jgi:hypothetical protein